MRSDPGWITATFSQPRSCRSRTTEAASGSRSASTARMRRTFSSGNSAEGRACTPLSTASSSKPWRATTTKSPTRWSKRSKRRDSVKGSAAIEVATAGLSLWCYRAMIVLDPAVCCGATHRLLPRAVWDRRAPPDPCIGRWLREAAEALKRFFGTRLPTQRTRPSVAVEEKGPWVRA
jgi:hypothetical protein